MWYGILFALMFSGSYDGLAAGGDTPTPNPTALSARSVETPGELPQSTPEGSLCRKCSNYYSEPFRCERESATRLGKFFCNRHLLRPTLRRCVGLACYAGIYGGSAYALHRFGTSEIAARLISNSLITFIALNGFDAMASCGALICSNRIPVTRTTPEKKKEVSFIIPVYGAKKNIQPTLDSIKNAGFSLDQVYVIENGTYDEISDAQNLCADPEYHLVNYRRVREWGSKVGAEVLGYALSRGRVGVVIDDDIKLPNGWDPEVARLDEEDVGLMAYSLAPSNPPNWLVDQQGAEYSAADRTLRAQAALSGTTSRVHGGGSAAVRDRYLSHIGREPAGGQFSGEDQRKSKAVTRAGLRIAMASGAPLLTEVPGDLATFEAQRITSWDLGSHLLGLHTFLDFSCNWGRGCSQEEVTRTLVRKVYEIQEMSGLAYDVIRPILMATLWNNPYFWVVTGALWEGKNLMNIAAETCCEPYRNGEKVCDSKVCLKSCWKHHTSAPYTILTSINGMIGACCAYVGAGAGRPQDYKLIETFPEDLREILNIQDKDLRIKAIVDYANQISSDPRTVRKHRLARADSHHEELPTPSAPTPLAAALDAEAVPPTEIVETFSTKDDERDSTGPVLPGNHVSPQRTLQNRSVSHSPHAVVDVDSGAGVWPTPRVIPKPTESRGSLLLPYRSMRQPTYSQRIPKRRVQESAPTGTITETSPPNQKTTVAGGMDDL